MTSQTGSNSVVHVYGLLTLPEVTSQTGSNSVVHVYGLLTLPEVTSQTGRHRYDYLTLPEVTVRYARTVFNPSRGGFSSPSPPRGIGEGGGSDTTTKRRNFNIYFQQRPSQQDVLTNNFNMNIVLCINMLAITVYYNRFKYNVF